MVKLLQTATPTNSVDGVITLANDGYYVIKETDVTDVDGYAGMTAYLLGVYDASVGAVVTVKSSVPSFQKKLKDTNDSATTNGTDAWQDSADYDIGDAVPFQLTATLPDKYNDYKKYKLTFHDNFKDTVTDKEVFTFKEITKVYVDKNGNGQYDDGETEIAAYNAATNTNGYKWSDNDSTQKGGATYNMSVTIDDLKAIYSTKGTGDAPAVVVEYTATLNTDAVIGSAGNWNDAYLSYTTNPNWDGTGTNGEEEKPKDSPVDTNVVFTYKTVINKVNPQGETLNGATFKLAKKYTTAPKNSDGTDKAALVVGEETYTGYYEVAEIVGTNSSSFEFKGLDDGDYILVETGAPTNYKVATKPVYFTITAEHANDPATLALTNLSVAGTTGVDDDGFINLQKIGNTDAQIAVDKENGEITASFINTSGADLPSTGGIGTTMFYIGGGAMVAVAGVFLITKKRMNKKEN